MKSLIPQKWREKLTVPSPFKKKNWLSEWWEDPFESSLSPFEHSLFKKYPHAQLVEERDRIKVKVELPGMDKKDIDLSWNNGILHIKAEKKHERKEKKRNGYYKEYNYSNFSRNIDVGKNVEWEKAKAKFKNGVLDVILPKTESAQKVIEVKVD